MNITIHVLRKVYSYWEAVKLMVVVTGFPKCSNCIIVTNAVSVFLDVTSSLHLFLTKYFPNIQTWINIVFKIKVRFHKKKKRAACSACISDSSQVLFLGTAKALWRDWALYAYLCFIIQSIKTIHIHISRLNDICYFTSLEMVFGKTGICFLWVRGSEE